MSKKNATGFVAVTALIPTNVYTTTQTGAKKDLSKILPQMVMAVLEGVPNGADANETLDVVVQGTNDAGTTWTTCATFTQVTQPGLTAFMQRKDIAQPIFREYRAVGTVGGTTPSFIYGVKLVGAHPTHAPITQV